MKQRENTPEQFTKWEMIGDDDATVTPSGVGVLMGQPHEVFHVEGQDGTPLVGRERQLLAV